MGIGRTGDRRERDARVGRSSGDRTVPVKAELAGTTYPPVSFAVEGGRVASFAAAVGHPGEGVPPTFATAPELLAGLEHALADPELGLDLSRVLHAEQAYEWRRPLRVGETLTAEATIEQIRAKGPVELLTLRTDLRDRAGDVVVVGRSMVVVRSPGP